MGPTDHVICALSGGVDSTVAATLVHKVGLPIGLDGAMLAVPHLWQTCVLLQQQLDLMQWHAASVARQPKRASWRAGRL